MDDFATAWCAAERQVRSYLRRFGLSHSDLDDVVQETALRAVRGYLGFMGRSEAATWFNTIAGREAIRYMGKKSKLKLGLVTEPSTHPLHYADSPWDLRAAIDEARTNKFLGEKEAQLIILHQDQLSWEQISNTIGIRADNCAKSHQRAILKFRVYLLLYYPNRFGTKAEIQEAFEQARADPINPLTEEELVAFRAVVLDRNQSPWTHGYWLPIQQACLKVAKKLPNPLG